ncbi:uncharacterized protein LOC144750577 [Ciona intestinalis]
MPVDQVNDIALVHVANEPSVECVKDNLPPTLGATSSPGCANFGLKRAADDEGKRIVQQLCKEGADWDDPVPNDLRYRWERWRNELQDIENLKINRCLHPVQFGTVQRKEIHHFSDASNVGYGQCSYIRLLNGEGVFQREDLYVRRRWRRVQYLANEFWVRWRKEFVQSLQKRNKWQRRMPNIAVDDIVLLDDDHAPRSKWRLARVLDTYPCPDGIVRKVQLMLSERERDDKGKRISAPSILDRPICKLIVLLRASEEKALQIAEDVARDSSTGSHDDEPRSALTLD